MKFGVSIPLEPRARRAPPVGPRVRVLRARRRARIRLRRARPPPVHAGVPAASVGHARRDRGARPRRSGSARASRCCRSTIRSTRPRRSPPSTSCRTAACSSARGSATGPTSTKRSGSTSTHAVDACRSASRSCSARGPRTPFSFHGEFFDFDDVGVYPKPVQQPRPTIWIGANSDAAVRRGARLTDGWMVGFGDRLPTAVDAHRDVPGGVAARTAGAARSA